MASSPTTVADLVSAGREYVRRAVGLELDGSVESLAYVDHYLTSVGKQVGDEVMALVAPAIGAYLGEVAIGHFGGSWQTEGEPVDWRVTLAPAPVTFCPAAMTAEAIRVADVDGVDASITVPRELVPALESALESTAPVEASYFYSLTGRFETLEHAVDVLVEVLHGDEEDEDDEPTNPGPRN